MMSFEAILVEPDPIPAFDSLLDIQQAAAMLAVSVKWLYRNYRNLPHILIPAGRKPRIRFRRDDLYGWIEAHSFDWRKNETTRRRVN